MKKLILIAGVIVMIYLALNLFVSPQADAPVAASASAQTAQQEKGFRIGVADDRVAVFRDGILYLKTETLLSSLPKSDRARLEEGIHVDSIKELKELLQDYCS
ncbi:MAG: hypothetical protein IJH40_07470 [Ruminococcus sp.]|uniref:hypothetical protein n=1 Tax=Ruminococcus sp. TaxID=41978 RepID=UPI0028730B66|nr:hypothetical protein [Ruminococcus sp.]MBQ3285465.1 hypothetical protein [Ruminococcus sp.]